MGSVNAVDSWGSPGVWRGHSRDDGKTREIYLAAVDDVDIEVEAAEARTPAVTRGVGFTIPSRTRARVWVNDDLGDELGIDAIIAAVQRLLGFEPDTPFYWVVDEDCREAQSAHRRGWDITVRRERQAWRRPATAIVYDRRDRRIDDRGAGSDPGLVRPVARNAHKGKVTTWRQTETRRLHA